MQSKGPNTYSYTVATVWSLSFERVQQASLQANDLLTLYCFLAPDDIANELILAGASELGPHLSNINELGILQEAQAHLLRYSLIQRNRQQKSVRIHRLVQTVYKDQLDEMTQRTWKERVIKAVYRVYMKNLMNWHGV